MLTQTVTEKKQKTKQQNQEHVKNIAVSKKKIRIILLTNPDPPLAFSQFRNPLPTMAAGRNLT